MYYMCLTIIGRACVCALSEGNVLDLVPLTSLNIRLLGRQLYLKLEVHVHDGPSVLSYRFMRLSNGISIFI